MAKPAARITDPTSCPIPGNVPKAIASGLIKSAPHCHAGLRVVTETSHRIASHRISTETELPFRMQQKAASLAAQFWNDYLQVQKSSTPPCSFPGIMLQN